MVGIGYHASHEQFPPGDLLSLVQRAERAGFGCAMCSDHFHPWSPEQGESGFAWAWLGSAMATTPIPFGVVMPQAWSASTMVALLQAKLGLQPYAPYGLLFVDPHMPTGCRR